MRIGTPRFLPWLTGLFLALAFASQGRGDQTNTEAHEVFMEGVRALDGEDHNAAISNLTKAIRWEEKCLEWNVRPPTDAVGGVGQRLELYKQRKPCRITASGYWYVLKSP
ncbi:MAG TPA: hypothetical protein VMP11_05710 [Verrucomicrobiae bacterium]|nr:hypothetical protein [Verrucomicrobiae bacterium]